MDGMQKFLRRPMRFHHDNDSGDGNDFVSGNDMLLVIEVSWVIVLKFI